ncbi:MAG: carbonic anhydrase [Candidatus Tokpelaia sp. JSC189]|nr:MAG: carbonic anhydrase [Candidatus Tokpelaia sp. JSC189]
MTDFPEKLLAGYNNFVTTLFSNEQPRYQELATVGQSPDVLVIACCDSRAAPEMIFNTKPGEIFVMRNVANQVPPFQSDGEYHATSAALEYAVQVLKVQHIVVLGHGRCGGIRVVLDMESKPLSSDDFIGRWMGLLRPAVEVISTNAQLTQHEREIALERISLRCSIANLRTFPWVNALERRGKLHLHAAWFDISSGELWVLDKKTSEFQLYE